MGKTSTHSRGTEDPISSKKKSLATGAGGFSGEAEDSECGMSASNNAVGRAVPDRDVDGESTPKRHYTSNEEGTQESQRAGSPAKLGEDNVLTLAAIGNSRYEEHLKDLLINMPHPGRNRVKVFNPYDRTAGIALEYTVSKDWSVSHSQKRRKLLLTATKDGQSRELNCHDFDEYRVRGWCIPDTPKIIGLDYLRETDKGDYVFITDDPLDYWLLNAAFSRDHLSRCGEYLLDEHEVAGAAIMPYHYDFGKPEVNAALTARKAVVIDYGEHEKAAALARRLASHRMCEAVSIWTLPSKMAQDGLFRPIAHLAAKKDLRLLGAALDAIHAEFAGVGGFRERLVKVDLACEADAIESIAATEQRWLWYPVFVAGAINMVVAEGGAGKSNVLTTICAMASRNELPTFESTWPPKTIESPTILWVTDEEDLGATVKPRFERVGYAPGKIKLMAAKHRPLTDPVYKTEIARVKADIVVFDSYGMLSTGDINYVKDVRIDVAALEDMIRETGVTPILIHHLNKEGAFSGSHRIRDSVRSMWQLCRDPREPGTLLLACDKLSSWFAGDKVPTVRFAVNYRPGIDKFINTCYAGVDQRSLKQIRNEIRASDIQVGESDAPQSYKEAISRFVTDRVETDGYCQVSEADGFGRNIGASDSTIKRAIKFAKKDMGLKTVQFKKTVYAFLPHIPGQTPGWNENVYVAASDLADTAGGLATIVQSLGRPVTAARLREMTGASLALVKKVFAELEADGYAVDSASQTLFPPGTATMTGRQRALNDDARLIPR